jgi:hypothetical protein
MPIAARFLYVCDEARTVGAAKITRFTDSVAFNDLYGRIICWLRSIVGFEKS